jgi:hypothetical protein
MQSISDQIAVLRNEITDLANLIPDWDGDRRSKSGGSRYRSMAKRIVESAKRLEALVKENTFPTA